MSIKNLKPNKKATTKQGYFPINECKKFKGKGPVIYRSSWEYKFCIWAERHPSVVSWSSENIVIEYWNSWNKKYSKYYPDFFLILENGDKIVIEVKPRKHYIKPTPPKRKTKKAISGYNYNLEQYVKNMCKFDAALKYCKGRGWKFKIVDENWFMRS